MHALKFLNETAALALEIDCDAVDELAKKILETEGRIYVIGLGGSYANAMHFAADLRRLCDVDAEAFTNMAELTARANDDGFDTIFAIPSVSERDGLVVLSVGGGTEVVSIPIAKTVRSFPGWVGGIVGPGGGVTADIGTHVVKVPVEIEERITPHTEAFQAVIWHCIVSNPILQRNPTKW